MAELRSIDAATHFIPQNSNAPQLIFYFDRRAITDRRRPLAVAFFAVAEESVDVAGGAEVGDVDVFFAEAGVEELELVGFGRSRSTFLGGGWWPGGIMFSHCSGLGSSPVRSSSKNSLALENLAAKAEATSVPTS